MRGRIPASVVGLVAAGLVFVPAASAQAPVPPAAIPNAKPATPAQAKPVTPTRKPVAQRPKPKQTVAGAPAANPAAAKPKPKPKVATVPASGSPAAAPRAVAPAAPRLVQPAAPRVAQAGAPRLAQAAPVPVLPTRAMAARGQATAFDANQRALVDKVSAYLSSMPTLVGNFVQVGPDGSRTTGDFYMQKPGRIRFEYDAPSPITLIADGQSIAVRDRKLATQDIIPLSQTPLRFLLADKIDLMRDTQVIGVNSDDMFVSVVIEEKSNFAGTHRLMLMFGAKDLQLRQWTITDPQGYDTTVAVYNLDASKRPDPGLFKIDYTRYQ